MAEAVQVPTPHPEFSGCGADLETFHQNTGQCWSDSAMVFLLFSNTLGPVVQKRLAEEGENIRASFEAWAAANTAKLNEIAGFELSAEELATFVDKAKQYLYCVNRRFQNSKLKEKPAAVLKRPELRRCDSLLFSYCQEATGILASEALLRYKLGAQRRGPEQEIEQVTREREANAGRSIQKYMKEGLIDVPAEQGAPGYNNLRVSKFIAVLVAFFKADVQPIELHSIQPEDLVGRLGAQDVCLYVDADKDSEMLETFIGKLGQNEEGSDEEGLEEVELTEEELELEMKKLLEEDEGGVKEPLTDKYDIDVTNYDFAVAIPEDIPYSVVVGMKSPTGAGHAICFLTCVNGEQYIYDDNMGILLKADWRRAIQNKYTRFFFAYMAGADFTGRPDKFAFLAMNPKTKDRILVAQNGVSATEGTWKFTPEQTMKTLKDRLFAGERGVVYTLFQLAYFFVERMPPGPRAAAGGAGGGAAQGGGTRRRIRKERRRATRRER